MSLVCEEKENKFDAGSCIDSYLDDAVKFELLKCHSKVIAASYLDRGLKSSLPS